MLIEEEVLELGFRKIKENTYVLDALYLLTYTEHHYTWPAEPWELHLNNTLVSIYSKAHLSLFVDFINYVIED